MPSTDTTPKPRARPTGRLRPLGRPTAIVTVAGSLVIAPAPLVSVYSSGTVIRTCAASTPVPSRSCSDSRPESAPVQARLALVVDAAAIGVAAATAMTG